MGSQTTSEQLDGWTHKVRKVVDQIPSPQLTTKTCKLHPIAIIYLGTVRDCSSSHQNDDCLLLFISQLSSTKIIRHSKHSGKGKALPRMPCLSWKGEWFNHKERGGARIPNLGTWQSCKARALNFLPARFGFCGYFLFRNLLQEKEKVLGKNFLYFCMNSVKVSISVVQ